MKAKLTKQLQKELIKKYELETPPPYTEGHWEDAMLENDSYWDLGIIEKHNTPIRKEIEKLIVEQSKSSSWLGKWYYQIQINKATQKLKHYR